MANKYKYGPPGHLGVDCSIPLPLHGQGCDTLCVMTRLVQMIKGHLAVRAK